MEKGCEVAWVAWFKCCSSVVVVTFKKISAEGCNKSHLGPSRPVFSLFILGALNNKDKKLET